MASLTSSAWLVWILAQPGVAIDAAGPFGSPHVDLVRQADSPAQSSGSPGTTSSSGREYFFSWGYNGDRYSNSDIHFSQPALGNDFTLADVEVHDSKAWTDLFSHAITVPQYNVRFGMFFNERWGVEVAMDHIKWIVTQDQQVRMTGTLNGAAVDKQVVLTPDVLRYQLNNGANPIFFNAIRRFRIAREPGRTGHVAFLAKAGAGFAVPHTENTLFDQPNDPGFQPFKGWNIDAVAAVRIHLYKPIYFEAEEKLLYARYYGVNIDRGEARHNLKASEFTFNFGLAFR
jgi:hypothetical protein